jgi:hypothetical protein
VVPKVHRRAGNTGTGNTQHDAPAGRLTHLGRGRKAIIVGASVVASSAAFAGSASAVIVEPPPAPLEIVVFPERDFVVSEGGPAGQALTFEIVRQGFVIGRASSSQVSPAMLTGDGGILEVNHPGGLCWQGSTPNILPGDKLVVTDEANPTDGYAVTTLNVSATQAEIVGTDVVVHGVALNNNGSALPLTQVEQRIVNPDFREGVDPMDKRDIRATTADGNLRRDPAVVGGFIATHSGLTPAQRQKAVEGQTRVLGWQATNAAGDRLGITIYEVGEVGGPGFGGCPAGQTGPTAPQLAAAQDSGTKGDHVTNQSANLSFSGLAGSDTAGASAEPGADAEVRLLVDGAVRASGVANGNGVYQFTGVNLTAGSHAVRVRAKDAGAAPTFDSAVRRVTVDKVAPAAVLRQLAPKPLHLAGTQRLRALFRISEAAHLTARIQHLSPLRTARTLTAQNIRSAGLVEYNWDGRNETNTDVRPGSYRLLLTVTDKAGNVRTETARFRVVH